MNKKSTKNGLILIFCILSPMILNAQRLNDLYLQARADMLMERYEDATEKILSIPKRERTAQMYFTLGESSYASGKYAQSARYFESSDSIRTNPEATLYAARAYAMLEQAVKSVELLQKYLPARDKILESEINLDPAFAKIERSRQWRDLWDREWYTAADRLYAQATILLRRGRHSEALDIIDAEIRRAATARFYALRAKVYQDMEQYSAAHQSAQTAVSMRTNYVTYFVDAATIAVNAKRYETALENINRAVRLEPYKLELYLQRASILRLNEQYDEARDDINFYFKYLPGDAKAIFQMGKAETEAGNPHLGIEYFTLLIENDNSSTDYFMARAEAGMRSSNFKLAHHDLSQVLDLNPSLPEAWHKKGVVLNLENQREDACFYWRRALQLGHREASDFIYRHCIGQR
jgi:tetratricopeptide (TPR) repeat protein